MTKIRTSSASRLERLLEIGLEETFPASDAVAVIEPGPIEKTAMIRKLKSGGYRLYSRKINPKTGKRRNLGTFKTRAEAEKRD